MGHSASVIPGQSCTIFAMSEKIIGSLIYGEHAPPPKARAWSERLKVPLSIGLALIIIGGLAYKFANIREERRVSQFVETLRNGQYEEAFKSWDADEHYTMNDFLLDWGKDGYYMKNLQTARVVDSNTQGTTVIVYLSLDTFKRPVALMVDKDTLKLSFSPTNKYAQ